MSNRLLPILLAPYVALPWLVRHWPAQDNANHRAIVYALMRLAEKDPFYVEALAQNLAPRPFMLQYYALYGLTRLVGLDAADRLLTSIVIMTGPLATWFVLSRVAPARRWNALVTVPLYATGTLVVWGLTNFLLGMFAGLVGIAFAWGRSGQNGTRTPPSSVDVIASALAFATAMLAHSFAAVLSIAILAAIELPNVLRRRTAARFVLVFAPAVALAAYGSLHATPPMISCGADEVSWRSAVCPSQTVRLGSSVSLVEVVVAILAGGAPLSPYELLFRTAIVIVLIAGAVRAFSGIGWRGLLRGGTADAALLRALALVVLLCVLAPRSLNSAALIVRRLEEVAIVLLVLAAPVLPRLSDRARSAIVALFTFALFVVQLHFVRDRSKQVEAVVELARDIPEHSTIHLTTFREEEGAAAELHAWGLVMIEHAGLGTHLFADGSDVFDAGGMRPIRYRRPIGAGLSQWGKRDLTSLKQVACTVDVLILVAPPREVVASIHEMDVIRHEGDLWLLQRSATKAEVR